MEMIETKIKRIGAEIKMIEAEMKSIQSKMKKTGAKMRNGGAQLGSNLAKMRRNNAKMGAKINFNENFVVSISNMLRSLENITGQKFSGRKLIRNNSIN